MSATEQPTVLICNCLKCIFSTTVPQQKRRNKHKKTFLVNIDNKGLCLILLEKQTYAAGSSSDSGEGLEEEEQTPLASLSQLNQICPLQTHGSSSCLLCLPLQKHHTGSSNPDPSKPRPEPNHVSCQRGRKAYPAYMAHTPRAPVLQHTGTWIIFELATPSARRSSATAASGSARESSPHFSAKRSHSHGQWGWGQLHKTGTEAFSGWEKGQQMDTDEEPQGIRLLKFTSAVLLPAFCANALAACSLVTGPTHSASVLPASTSIACSIPPLNT